MMIRLLRFVLVAGCFIVALSACIYKMDIAQGNRIPEEVLNRLEIGMTRNQVLFLLGTPAVQDPYRTDKWHYINYLKDNNGRNLEQHNMVLSFTGDELTEIRGTLSPS